MGSRNDLLCCGCPHSCPQGSAGREPVVTFGVAPSCSQLSLLKARAGPGPGQEYLKASCTLRACLREPEIQRMLRGLMCCPVPSSLSPSSLAWPESHKKGTQGRAQVSPMGPPPPIYSLTAAPQPPHHGGVLPYYYGWMEGCSGQGCS